MAITSGPLTVVSGLKPHLEQPDDQRRDADGEQHWHQRQESSCEAAAAEHEEQCSEAECQVGEVGPVGRQVLEQSDAHRGETGGGRPNRILSFGEIHEQDTVGRKVEGIDARLQVGFEFSYQDRSLLEARRASGAG